MDGEAGDLRRHHANYDVTVMLYVYQRIRIGDVSQYGMCVINWKQYTTLYARVSLCNTPDSKVHGSSMGPIWGRQDPGGPNVGPIEFAVWSGTPECYYTDFLKQ